MHRLFVPARKRQQGDYLSSVAQAALGVDLVDPVLGQEGAADVDIQCQSVYYQRMYAEVAALQAHAKLHPVLGHAEDVKVGALLGCADLCAWLEGL